MPLEQRLLVGLAPQWKLQVKQSRGDNARRPRYTAQSEGKSDLKRGNSRSSHEVTIKFFLDGFRKLEA